METLKVYEYALQREREGVRFFRENAQRFSHAAVIGAFERLAKEEERHIRFIRELIAAHESGRESQAKVEAPLAEKAFFSERAASEVLDQTVIESMVPDLSVLRMAYLIERDFAEFYEMAAERVTEEPARASLEMLARWERGHERLFKEMHDRAFNEYAGMPWGG
jgi:rubrerythrin